MMRYAIVIECVPGNYSAYVPDLPGCIATDTTLDNVRAEIRAAIALHIQGMRDDGLTIPEPSSDVEYVDVAP
jgi:predicted RNase H-like HicB family nuclease